MKVCEEMQQISVKHTIESGDIELTDLVLRAKKCMEFRGISREETMCRRRRYVLSSSHSSFGSMLWDDPVESECTGRLSEFAAIRDTHY